VARGVRRRGGGPVEHYIVTESSLAPAPPRSSVGSASTSSVPRCSRTELRAEGALSSALLDATRSGASCSANPAPASDSDVAEHARDKVDGGFLVNVRSLDELRAVRRLGLVPRPHRSRRAKSKGISALVIDMHASGVDVRPLRQITDESEFNESSSPTSSSRRPIGRPLHEGWRVANSTLTHERGVNPRTLVAHSQLLDELWKLGLENDSLDDPRLAAVWPGVRGGPHLPTAQLALDLRTAKGRSGPVAASQAVWRRDEQTPARHKPWLCSGPRKPLWRGAHDNPGDGVWQRSWLYYQPVRSGGHERDQAATSSGTHARAAADKAP